MGIERFFSSIDNENTYVYEFMTKINTKYLYIDFNSIVYNTHRPIINDFNYILRKIIEKDLNDSKFINLCNNYNIKKCNNINEYKKILNDDFINKNIVNGIEEYIVDKILGSYIQSNELKYFYIAVDGVPSYSKIHEQKKRRYLSPVQANIQKKILLKNKKDLLKNKNKYNYILNKIHWNTGNITPGTIFMDEVDKKLSSSEFIEKIKKICPNLEKYIYSGIYQPGEGEKKIVDNLRSLNGEKSNYLIYSPDSDVIVLSLLLNNKFNSENNHNISSLKMFRRNQQKKKV